MPVVPPDPSVPSPESASPPFVLSPSELRQQFDESQRLAGIGSWTWDLSTGAVAWSQETYRVLRIGFDQTPNFELVLARAIDAAHAQQFMDHLNAALRGDAPYDFEIAARVGGDAQDEIVIVHTRGTVERDAEGTPVRMTGTVQDVTAMRRAEQALRDSEGQFRTLADASPLGVFRTDALGHVTYANQRLLDLFGCDLAAFASGAWLAQAHRDDRPSFERDMARTIGSVVPFHREYRIAVAGVLRWVRVHTQPVLDEHGATLGHVGSVLDTTDERRAEEERARLHTQLEQARRLESLGLLAGGIAHDFNNLLVGILANATLARDDIPASSPARDVLDDIARAAQRAGELTRQLLAYAGKTQPERRPVALAPLLRELPILLGARIPATVTLVIEPADEPVVDGDATQLRQVVLNLLTNAVDAIGDAPGRVEITLTLESVDAARLAASVLGQDRLPGRYVVLRVRDTGRGMPPAVQERMFDPFFTTKDAGRGLGLAATLGIIQAHDGAVQVSSAPGNGTCVCLLLPPSRTSLSPASVPAVPPPQVAGTGTLLLVDDDDGARSAARRILTRAGFAVVEAANGRDALDRYAAMPVPPQAILLDISMPIMGGAECLTELRRQGIGVPVLLISGFDPDDVAAVLVERGVAALLRKPYTMAELLAAVQTLLG
jgi:two-component system cell cycle sensor histidine kinase/response regulator CckA